jgi:hypothetical protein
MEKVVNTFILNRAFFGKINCLKILMNSEKEVYFHLGLKKMGNWDWKKVKMSDNELGEIINVLSCKDGACSFFHSYNEKKAQIWIKKSEKSCNVKINEVSKNLTVGEFEVLRILLEQCVRMMNF